MTEIRQMTYRPGGKSSAAVEVLSFDRLRILNDGGTQRADFHVVALVDAGHGSVSIDFADHPLAHRRAVWIAPGAVHRWTDIGEVAGRLVLFVPTAPVTRATRELVASPGQVPGWEISEHAWPFVTAALWHLELEVDPAAADPPPGLPEILLSALIARLHPPRPDTRPGDSIFELFRSSVEAQFRRHHDAGHYARELGYAPRTLTRAVQQATGRTAKAYITDRIILQAKRLLAHDLFTSARCAAELGFIDASSFSSFFLKATGQRPGAWQRSHTMP
jgi:AraC-like DNA-binding protein